MNDNGGSSAPKKAARAIVITNASLVLAAAIWLGSLEVRCRALERQGHSSVVASQQIDTWFLNVAAPDRRMEIRVEAADVARATVNLRGQDRFASIYFRDSNGSLVADLLVKDSSGRSAGAKGVSLLGLVDWLDRSFTGQ